MDERLQQGDKKKPRVDGRLIVGSGHLGLCKYFLLHLSGQMSINHQRRAMQFYIHKLVYSSDRLANVTWRSKIN